MNSPSRMQQHILGLKKKGMPQPEIPPQQMHRIPAHVTQDFAVHCLSGKHMDAALTKARELFSVVAHRHQQQMPEQKVFNLPAVWAAFCSDTVFEDEISTVDAIAYLGQVEIDALVMEGGEAKAEEICVKVFDYVNRDLAMRKNAER